tara:strand:+ start:210 stop:428 length:219 start_codon:yes stop_codon:yes gene_type:complete
MAKFENYLKEYHIKNILTMGGIVAVAIGASYIVKTYLDCLRIKVLRSQLKTKSVDKAEKSSSGEDWVLQSDD